MVRSVSVLVFLLGSSLFAQSPQYTIHDLGALNNGAVTGINIRGQVIGYETNTDGTARSFRTAPNSPINWTADNLGTLGGSTTRARDINASGQVVGESTLSSGELRAFRTAPNSSIQPATDNLGTLDGRDTQAFAISDDGRVTGVSGNAFRTQPNQAIDPANDELDVKYGVYQATTKGLFINNRGHVLGQFTAGPVYPTAFINTGRESQPLDAINYIWQGFTGLTDQDQFVFNDTGAHLMLWQNGSKTILANCMTPCVPTSVNNLLQVVGSTMKNQFLYSNGTITDLTTLLPQGSGWTLPDPISGPTPLFINDLGQIAGNALWNGQPHAIRLDPATSVTTAIQQVLDLVSAIQPNYGRRSTAALMMKLSLSSQLQSALSSWSGGNAPATRGLLNEFENMVRSQSGRSLTTDQADSLVRMAETAFNMT